MKTELKKLFDGQGLSLSEKQLDDFEVYAKLLVEWNEKINLTAITDDAGICEKHFLDSVLPLTMTDIPSGATLIDVGTGAGFPAVPMRIFRDDLKITLLDSLNKRINFLSEVSDKLSLGAECVHARAEDGGRDKTLREKFDVATARAVAALPVLAEYCLPYVKVGGVFLALKGPSEDIDAAKKAISVLGGEIESVREYTLPCGDGRKLITIRKISHTSTAYPRITAQIKKKNL